MRRNVTIVATCVAVALLTAYVTAWLGNLEHVNEPTYDYHPQLFLLDVGVPVVYFCSVLIAVSVVQRLTSGQRVSSFLVALCTWGCVCWFLYVISGERVTVAVRDQIMARYQADVPEQASAYAAKVRLYFLAGFAAATSLGATLGIFVSNRVKGRQE